MANIGLRKPYVGKKVVGGYETPATIGKAVSVEITPNYAEASLYGDDALDEYVKEFVDADATLGTTTIPIDFYNVLFGHAVSASSTTEGAPKDHVVYNKDDNANYVGFGLVGVEMIGGVKKFTAMFCPKTKWSEPATTLNTKGDNIEFGTPEITGKVIADDDAGGNWKETQVFDTEEAAVTWLTGKFTPVAAG